jgi:quercetin dioxygenase-like cupin family protein/ubiquinone/menaquinone biosynthesis C-methylase UbiE
MDRKAIEEYDAGSITARTLGYYELRAEEFRAGTWDHDVSQNIAALLRHIEGAPPFTILDFGCGPGRDLKAFAALGHTAIGLDGAAAFAAMARAATGCEIWQQDFLALDLPSGRFHGIFANASLFHVPPRELPRVLAQLHAALKPAGILFTSNPRGENEEGWNGERYGAYHDLAAWRRYLADAGFEELDHYYRPAGLPREQQPWLATVWRKVNAKEGIAMLLKRAGSQPSQKGSPNYFTGNVRLDPLNTAPEPSRVSCASVTFEPGARTAWHTHPLGQTLVVTAGCGWTQCAGEPIVEIRAGDVIWCPPNHRHWHGATPTTSMTHIAIQEALDGKFIEWMQHVTDEEYLAGPSG